MKYKLDDVCIFINGGAWSDKEYVNKGLPVLKVTNCKSKGFELDDIDYLPISSSQLYAKNKLVAKVTNSTTYGKANKGTYYIKISRKGTKDSGIYALSWK